MTNEEKANEIIQLSDANQVYDIVDFDSLHKAQMEDLLAMAQWKDEQFAKEKQELIDKACDWLRNNMYEGTCEQILSKKPYPSMNDFIDEIKQVMKGGKK